MADEPQLEKLTAKEFANWSPTVSVLARVVKHLISRDGSINAIAPYLRNGLIRSGAGRHAFEGEPPGGVIEIEKERWGKPDEVDLTELYEFWRSGTLTVRYRGDLLTYFDVRFDHDGVAALMAAVAPDHEPPPAPASIIEPVATLPKSLKHAGGRPPYDWESIWAAVGARLAAGWKPRQQKDIEAEMKLQAENLGMKPAPKRTVLQERASKLAKALGLKD